MIAQAWNKWAINKDKIREEARKEGRKEGREQVMQEELAKRLKMKEEAEKHGVILTLED